LALRSWRGCWRSGGLGCRTAAGGRGRRPFAGSARRGRDRLGHPWLGQGGSGLGSWFRCRLSAGSCTARSRRSRGLSVDSAAQRLDLIGQLIQSAYQSLQICLLDRPFGGAGHSLLHLLSPIGRKPFACFFDRGAARVDSLREKGSRSLFAGLALCGRFLLGCHAILQQLPSGRQGNPEINANASRCVRIGQG
jgi:hypothetical protein